MTDFDVIVVGASVAGSTLAAQLGRHGLRVLLLDKARFPRQKVCGEGLMPGGAKILSRLGILDQVRHQGAQPFSGVCFYLPRNCRFELSFDELTDKPRGWVVPRAVLDTCLAQFAAQQPLVQLHEGFKVGFAQVRAKQVEIVGTEQGARYGYTAKVLIAADGIRSRFHSRFGIQRRKQRCLRFALRTTYGGFESLGNMIEVHCDPRGEAYVAPQGNGRVRITLLLFGPLRRSSDKGLNALYLENLRLFPRLCRRLKTPYPQHEVESTGPLSLEVSRCHGQRTLFIGDAGGAVDPVTGQGMTLALKDAELAFHTLKERIREDRLSEDDLSEYTRHREGYFRPSFHLAQTLLSSVHHPFLANQAIKALRRNRSLRHKIMGMAADPTEGGSLTRGDQLHLLLGR